MSQSNFTPAFHWIVREGFAQHHQWMISRGRFVTNWPDPIPGRPETECFDDDECLWITRKDFGGVRFTRTEREIVAYPRDGVEPEKFRRLFTQEWLPLIYPLWGIQVLHAGAAVHLQTNRVVAFCGPSGVGKSTFAFALGRRPGWQQIADEAIAFKVDSDVKSDGARLLPIPNEVRLRPLTAAHYGASAYNYQPLSWIQAPLALRRVYFLKKDDELRRDAHIEILSRSEGYTETLKQAFALSLRNKQDNQRLMSDYLTLSRTVGFSRLIFRDNIALVDEIAAMVEHHVLYLDRARTLRWAHAQ